MSPEENMIVILQNVLMFIYSSIGYVMLLPFYQVRNIRREKVMVIAAVFILQRERRGVDVPLFLL